MSFGRNLLICWSSRPVLLLSAQLELWSRNRSVCCKNVSSRRSRSEGRQPARAIYLHAKELTTRSRAQEGRKGCEAHQIEASLRRPPPTYIFATQSTSTLVPRPDMASSIPSTSPDFRDPKADIVLRSQDGVAFPIQRLFLLASSSVFADMFLSVDGPKDGRLPEIQMEEKVGDLERYLRFLHRDVRRPTRLSQEDALRSARTPSSVSFLPHPRRER